MKVSLRFSVLVSSFFSSLLWSLNLLLFLYTLLVYYFLYQLPIEHWIGGVVMISLPIAWGLNILFLLFWVLVNPWRALLPLITMFIGIPFWRRTFAFNHPREAPAQTTAFRVMSYNVTGFNNYNLINTQRPDDADRMIQWVLKEPADIKCFQEFYNDGSSVVFRTVKRLEKAGYPYYALLNPPDMPGREKFIGVGIFSRYPIVRRGNEVFKNWNGLVWADVKIGTDTVRIISVHLQSMGIRVGGILKEKEIDGVKNKTRGVFQQLRYGFTMRREQITRVEEYCRKSPYPVIISGDYNDTPYSLVYGRMRHLLHNAFEDAGRGLGFSYNKAPGFIRIDNQFYDARRLDALNYTTYRAVKFSDHYPIEAQYAIKPKNYGKEPQTHVEMDF